jgi:hypothetical protein
MVRVALGVADLGVLTLLCAAVESGLHGRLALWARAVVVGLLARRVLVRVAGSVLLLVLVLVVAKAIAAIHRVGN